MAPLSVPSIVLVLLVAAFVLANDKSGKMAKRQQLAADPAELAAEDVSVEVVKPTVDSKLAVGRRLCDAHAALKAWKRAIFSDPLNFTGNWEGPHVCTYNGVFCAPALDDPSSDVVAGIDLNGGYIAGHIPPEIGLLRELSLLHINSNRFNGTIPATISELTLIYELDLSNNRFSGDFPKAILSLPNLRYLDLRYNRFSGTIPPSLFEKPLDALFLNHNRFSGTVPPNIGNSTISIAVLAHNHLSGHLPPTIGDMASTLEEILLLHNHISGCIPDEIGLLGNATIIDVSHNSLLGPLPSMLSGLLNLQVLNVAHNALIGEVPASLCRLPRLLNFTFSNNFLNKWSDVCVEAGFDGRDNCFEGQLLQRSTEVCLSSTVKVSRSDCKEFERGVAMEGLKLDGGDVGTFS